MQQLVEMLLSGQIRLPAISPDLLALDQEVPKTDLLALLILNRRGEATMSELAADLNVPLSTATGIGARLGRRGLTERERSAQDKRVIVNRLTAEGRALAVRVQSHIDGILQRITAALTPEEVTILMVLVQKVLHAFQQDPLPLGERAQEPQQPDPASGESQAGVETGPRRIKLDD